MNRDNFKKIAEIWQKILVADKTGDSEGLHTEFKKLYSFYIGVISDLVIHSKKMKKTAFIRY